MKKFFRFIISLVLGLLVVASIGWYLFSYDRDFTRDTLLSQARFHDEHGNSRMSSMARNEMIFGHAQSPEEAVEKLEKVTVSDVHRLAKELLDFEQMSFSAVGNVSQPEEYLALFR